MMKIVINNLLLEINVITFDKVINGYFLFRRLNLYSYVSVKFHWRFFEKFSCNEE